MKPAPRAEAPEEIVVRGRRLVELGVEVEKAREHAAIFNEINSNDDFDVHCRDERKYISGAAADEWPTRLGTMIRGADRSGD